MSDDDSSSIHDNDSVESHISFDKKFVIKLTNENKDVAVSPSAKQSCKVLQISSNLDIREVLSAIKPSEYPKLFMFIIAYNSKSLVSAELDKLHLLGDSRPLIILQTCEAEKGVKIFYKKENTTTFIDIDELNTKDYKQSDYRQSILNFINDYNLESLEDEIFKKFRLIDDFSTILRFLRTLNFEERLFGSFVLKVAENGSKTDLLAVLDTSFEDSGRILSAEAQNYIRWDYDGDESSDDDQNDKDSGSEISSDDDQDAPTDRLAFQPKQKDSNQSVLMTAVQHSNREIIDYMVTYCTHLIQQLPVEHQIRVSTEAFDTKQFDVICDLLKISDFPFPDQFTITKSKIDKGLNQITEERMEFKVAIEREDFGKIDSFIDKNVSHKFIYSIDNNSALTEAIKARQFGVFYYLKSLGFQGENCQDVLIGLKKEEKTEAIEIATQQRKTNIQSSLKYYNRSVDNLCGKSLIHNRKISKDLEAKCREFINSWFISIHKIAPEMLDVAASCEHLKIIFDFESKTVENASLESPTSLGTSYSTQKWIFVGAKFTNKAQEQKIKGVLAHELCHYVMGMVYENQEFPYYKGDKITEDIFKEIVAVLDKWSITKTIEPDDECNGIISTVYSRYQKIAFVAELIVRVVNILAHFDDNPAKTKFLKKKYKILFKFWCNHVVPEMLNYFKREKVAIRVNKTVGLLKTITDTMKDFKIEFLASKIIEQLAENKATVVTTNVPKLLLINIYCHFERVSGYLMTSQNVFLHPEIITNEQVWMDLKDLHFRDVKLNAFVDCTKVNQDNWTNILGIKEFNFILIASNEEKTSKLKTICKKKMINPKTLDINYKWNDLTEESQRNLLESEVTFQNNSDLSLMELLSKPTNSDQTEILSEFSDIINDQLFNLLIDEKEICLNSFAEDEQTQNKIKVLYQMRTFLKKGVNYKNEISQEKLISITEDKKYVLISDIAGSGKSWVVKNILKIIRNRTPTRWVTYIDLKEFIEEFKQPVQALDFPNFFVNKILKPKTEFEAKIFIKIYEIGKVTIIFDGFDEIAPDYAEFVAALAKSFEFNNGNQLWIATRDYFEVNLQEKLGIKNVYKLDEFTEEEGINFIAMNWILMDLKDQKGKDLENLVQSSPNLRKYQEKAAKIVKNVTVSNNQSIGLPQLFSMIASGYKDDNFIAEDLKRAKIFTQFVNKMYKRWIYDKGELNIERNVNSQHYMLGFIRFHHYCAIASLLPEQVDSLFPDHNKSEWPEEDINACGIVIKIGSSYSFVHETFREFFVADFIFKSLKDPRVLNLIINLLIQVLTIQKYGIIRMFLNDFMDNYSAMENLQLELEKTSEKIYNMENFSEFFTENQEHLVKLIIEILKKVNYENVRKLISDNFKAVATNTKDLEMFLSFTEFVFSFIKDKDLIDMITAQNVLHAMIRSDQDIEIFENFVAKLEDKFGSEFVQRELKKMPTGDETGSVFHHLATAQNLNQQKVQKFLVIIQKYLNENKIAELIDTCAQKEHLILKILVTNSRNFKPFFDGAESFLVDRNLFPKIKNIIRKTDSDGRHILHWSADKEGLEFHASLWNLMKKIFENQDELGDFVLQKNCRQDTFLQNLIMSNKSDVIELTLNKLKEMLKQADYQAILRSKGKKGRNLLQTAAMNSIEVETHKILWKEFREFCKSDEEFLEILGEVDENCDNVLGLAATFSTEEILKFMQTELERIESKEKVKKLLINLGFAKRHFLQAAAYQNKFLKVHKVLWEILKNYFDFSETLEFLKHCDEFGDNLLITVEDNTSEVKILIWEKVEEVIRNKLNNSEITEEHKEIIQKYKEVRFKISKMNEQKDEKEHLKLKWLKNENSELTKLFDEATQQFIEHKLKIVNLKNLKILFRDKNIENHKKLWEKLTCNDREINEKLATEVNEMGDNFMHLLVIFNTAEIIEFTLHKFKENLHQLDYKLMLKLTGQLGRNLLQLAAVASHEVKTHQTLWKEIRESCNSNEEFLEILKEVDLQGNDVFGIAASFTTGEIFEFIYQELIKVASPDEIKNILKKLGSTNRNLFQSAVSQNKSLEFYKSVWKIIKENFNSFEILEFVTHCDDYGENLLIAAKGFSTIEIIEETWTEVKDVLTKLYKDTETIKKIRECQKIITKVSESKDEIENENDEETKLLRLDWIKNLESGPLKSIQENYRNNLTIRTALDLKPFASNRIVEHHITLWDHLEKSQNKSEFIAELMLKKSKCGHDFTHVLVASNSFQVIQFTLHKCKQKLQVFNFIKILRSKGEFGQNLLQTAAMNSYEIETHQILWKELQDSCKSYEEFLEILEEVDFQGNNVFGLAAIFSTAKILKLMQIELEIIGLKEKVKKLLTNLGFARRHLLQGAAAQNKSLEVHKVLWEIVNNYFSSFEILEFIKHRDSYGDNLLLHIISKNTKEVKELTWNKVKEILISIGHENNKNLKIIDEVMKKYEKIDELKTEERKILKFEWIKSEESVQLFEVSNDEFINQKVTCVMSQKDLVLLMADENADDFWNILEKSFDNYEQLRELFFENDSNGYKFINHFITCKELSILEFTFKKLEAILNESDFKEMFTSRGQHGRNLLQVAAAASKDVKTHQIIWKYLSKSCKSNEEILEILGQVDNSGDNILIIAASFTTGEIFELIEEELVKIASRDKIRKLLIKLGFGNKNLLREATHQNNSLEFHKTLWKILRKYFNLSEIKDFVIYSDEYNALKIALKNSNEILNLTWKEAKQILLELYTDTATVQNIEECEKVIQNTLEFGIESCSEEEIKVLNLDWIESTNLFDDLTQKLLKSNFTIQNINDLKPIWMNKNFWCHEMLWEHLEKNFEKKELTKLLLEKHDVCNCNFMNHILFSNTFDVLEFTLQKLKKNLNESNYQELLLSKGHLGRNLLQVAAAYSDEIKTHQILWKELRSLHKFDEKFSEIFEEVDEHGKNVIHLAAANTTSEIFEYIISELENYLHHCKIKTLLVSLETKNLNLLQLAAITNRNLETHKSIWRVISKYLSTEEIFEFIEHCDMYDINLLFCAIYYNTTEIVDFSWNQISTIINTKESQIEYLKRKENETNDSNVADCEDQIVDEFEIEFRVNRTPFLKRLWNFVICCVLTYQGPVNSD